MTDWLAYPPAWPPSKIFSGELANLPEISTRKLPIVPTDIKETIEEQVKPRLKFQSSDWGEIRESKADPKSGY